MAYPVTAEIDTYGALSDGQDSMGLQVHPPQKKVRPLFQIKSLTPLLYFFRGKYSWTPQLEQFLVSPPPWGFRWGGEDWSHTTIW